MNKIDKAIKLEKLKDNTKRLNYLKILSLSGLAIDIFTYLTFESIDLAFEDLSRIDIIMCFATKVR